MSAPNPRRQRVARQVLDKLISDAENVWVIHYSCESFFDLPEGRSPRITSIAVRGLASGQTVSFSIHQVAEEKGISFAEIGERYAEIEREMLSRFYTHVNGHQNMRYMHWNMRDVGYGFAALEHRFRALAGQPTIINDDRKFDLARLLVDIYGTGYIGHPRLEKLIERNNITRVNFLTGAQEAVAFEQGRYFELHWSTLRKVDIIANIAYRAADGQLLTNTSWWEMNGGSFRSAVKAVSENAVLSLGIGIVSLTLTVIGLYYTL